MRPFLCLVAVWIAWMPQRMHAVELSSGNRHVFLIELFTSEGCSSCPPAEAWLGQLSKHPQLWQDFVPIAFHVDYWNRLGWRDVFSTPANTQRQYEYARVWQTSSVYTPCFVRDGVEWRGARTLESTGANPGMLRANYDGARIRITFASTTPIADHEFEMHGALLAGGITSNVRAGENRGKILEHEFVAVTMISGAMGESLSLAAPALAQGRRLALAVWVTRKGSPGVLQATGGWLE